MIESRRAWLFLILGGYTLMCATMALHHYYYPSDVNGADAWGYINYAIETRASGLPGTLDPLRTYGYVWFLYFCSLLFGTGRQALGWGAVCVQIVLYAVAVCSLMASVARHRRPLARAIGIGLFLNPILVALVMDTLTEGLALIAAVFVMAILLRAAAAPTIAGKLMWLTIGATIASFALVIRPANLAVLLAWNVAVLPILFGPSVRATLKALLTYTVIASAVSLVVWSPQLLITHRVSGHASVIPTGLGNFQVIHGLRLIKYATQVKADGNAAAMNYPNPWLPAPPDAQPWQWYFNHPLTGVLITASHVFNAMNYDHPFVYVYDVSLPWSVPLAFICWVIYFLAASDIATDIRRWRSLSLTLPEFAPGVLFLLTMTAASLATIAVSAVESRFSTLIFAAAGVLACHRVLRLNGLSQPQRFRIAAAAIVVGTLGTMISEWMKSLLNLT